MFTYGWNSPAHKTCFGASDQDGFFRYDFQGLDPQGNPIYSADKVTVLDKPRGVNTVARVCYLDDSDTLVLAEEGGEENYKAKSLIYRWKPQP